MLFRTLIASTVLAAVSATASASDLWVGTWRASPQPLWDDRFVLPTQAPATLRDQTVRQPMRVSLGGHHWRVAIANTYGRTPLHVGAATFARSTGADAIATPHALTFGGQPGVEVPPGAEVLSDPVHVMVPSLSKVAVSVYLPGPVTPSTFHWDARETGWARDGNAVSDATLPQARAVPVRLFVSRLLVAAPAGTAGVVVIGDSLTDGNGSTPGDDRRWPDALADRVAHRGWAVQNAGISGARLLGDGMGTNALARLDAEVSGAPHVRTVIVALGTNDIGWPGGPFAPAEAPMTVDRLAAGYRHLVTRLRAQGIRVVGTTVPPFEGALAGTPLEGHHSPAKEAVRQAVNAWIRDSGAFDAVVDFDALLRDPAHPARLSPAFDSGDHLHPNDLGYRAMAAAVVDTGALR